MLSASHYRQLKASGIDTQVAAERGYRTVARAEVPEAFAGYQRRAGLLMPMFSPDGITQSCQLRPDTPRKNGPKYEAAAGKGFTPLIDVHPRAQEEVRHGAGDLWITEGLKKGDSLVSRGESAVSLAGVWMAHVPKSKPRRLLPCWDHVRLEGRRVYLAFDSDLSRKQGVQDAAEYLVGALQERGAEVLVVYLPDAQDGSKQGVDDYLAAGRTVSELKMLARKFETADFGRVRLGRDQKLRAAVEELRRRWWSFDWARLVGTGERPNSMRGHTARDVAHVLIDAVARHGRVKGDEVHVSLSQRTIAERAATRQATVAKSIAHLWAEGWIEVRPAESRDKPAVFVFSVPRAKPYHVGREATTEGKSEEHNEGDTPLRAPLRSPRLRWSAPTFERDAGRVVRGYIRRLGKINGSIIDLLDREGEMYINEVAEALNKRARDVRRRNLPKLEEAGVIAVEGDTVRLADDWRDALERERELKGEIEAAQRQRTKHALEREAYQKRNQINPDPHWANVAGADGYVEDLRPADESEASIPEEPPDETQSRDDEAIEFVLARVNRLGRIRLGLLEESWLEDGDGDLRRLREAVDAAGVRKMRLPEYQNRLFLYPPLPNKGVA